MAEDDTSKYKLDLDTKAFIGQAISAKNAINDIGNSESLTKLIAGLTEVSLAVGVLGVAFLALKGTFDTVFEAENIKAINAQFELLSTRAGAYSETLKRGLVESANGWATETELMQAANQALVKLEVGATQLPQLMNLARQATAVMGGSMIENFNGISQAVATGTTRQLRHLGIIIDQKKAYEEYARSIGETVSSLSLAGRQQAILNAVLEKNPFAGINTNIKENQTLWIQFKNTMTEVWETLAIGFDRVFGGVFSRGLTILKGMAVSARDLLQANFGTDLEKATANAKSLTDQIDQWNKRIVDLREIQSKDVRFQSAEKQAELNKEIAEYQSKIDAATVKVGALHAAEKSREQDSGPTKSKVSFVDSDLATQERIKQAKALEAIDAQTTQQEIANNKSVADADRLYHQEMMQDAERLAIERQEVWNKQAQGELTLNQAREQSAALDRQLNQKMMVDDEKLEQMRIQAAQKRLASETRVDQQIAAAAQVNSMKTADNWKKAGGTGGAAVTAFSNRSIEAFKAIGDGSKDPAEAVKAAFLGALGDIAIQKGTFMVLEAIWPPNPVEFAAGGALIALGAALGSMGGSTPSSGGGGSGGVGSLGSLDSGTNSLSPAASASAPAARQSVQLIVQGHMMMTDQTQRWLVDQIRAASDATDFTIRSVNGGFG